MGCNTKPLHGNSTGSPMVVTLGQQYNIGEKPTVMLFFPFNVLVANPKKTILYTVANPARGLLNREKRTKEVWQHTLATPTLLVRRKIKNTNHATHLQALRRSRSVSRPYKDIFGSSTRH